MEEESANVQNDEKNFASMLNSDERTYNEVKRRSTGEESIPATKE